MGQEEKAAHIDYNTYTDCLRIQIYPDEDAEQRIESVTRNCIKYGIKNVMLFVNAESFWVGHITKKQLIPWTAVLKKAAARFRQNGISVSLNLWTTIGHLDRGRKLAPGQNFSTMTDIDGRKSDVVVCPLDENWRKYYAEIVTDLIKAVRPDIFWVEDDFRLHNHAPLYYGGCFCEKHMSLINSKLKKNYTREEFRERLYRKGGCTPERKAWLDVNRETMVDLAEFFGGVIGAEPETAVALMSSTPDGHLPEARNWEGIFKGLCGNGRYIDRIHIPCYEEIEGKDYLFAFNSVSLPIRAFLPENTVVYPELENASFSTYAKDKRFLRFQEESAAPLIVAGTTYDIFDFTGNGWIDGFGYGEEIAAIRPYMQGILDLGVKFSDMRGAMIPIDEEAVYKVYFDGKDIKDYISSDCRTAGFYASMGANCQIVRQKEFFGETLVLFGNQVNYFDDEQLKKLFADNFLVLDGKALIELNRRELLSLIGATEISVIKNGIPSYEKAEKCLLTENIPNYKATMLYKTGDYVRVSYTEGADVKTGVYDYNCARVGEGIVRSKNALLLPYCLSGEEKEFFNPLRRNVILSEIAAATGTEFVATERAGISPYLYKKTDGGYVLIVLNATLSGYEPYRFKVANLTISGAYMLDKKTGCKRRIDFTSDGTILTLAVVGEGLSTDVFIFE